MWHKPFAALLLLVGISGTYGLHRLIKSHVDPKLSLWNFVLYLLLHFVIIFLMVFIVSFLVYKTAGWGNLK